VRALDNLTPQVHEGGARPTYLAPEVELQVGDVRDPNAIRRLSCALYPAALY
jgi:dTDP-L-rhamnose 4-epimerase